MRGPPPVVKQSRGGAIMALTDLTRCAPAHELITLF
jgi:hypothetical protein